MNPVLVISAGFIISVVLERLFPRSPLPYKEGWFVRAVSFNLIQLVVLIIAEYTWNVWLEGPSIFKLPWSSFWNGLFAYLVHTWVFYWWHYVRHDNNFLWLAVHQFHHSPVRIETITSYYKHPLEIILNSLILTIVTCLILGLDTQTNAWLLVLSAFAEFFYHFNVRTPYWLGYFIQRPEMHLVHHQENSQYTWNHGDISIWDLLNGTWFNPTDKQVQNMRTGFSEDRETKVLDMMLCKNVLTERPKKLPANLFKAMIISLVFLIGALNMIGVIFDSPTMKGLAMISTASPLPYVFTSYHGVETFATTFDMEVLFKNGSTTHIAMDHKLYSRLEGPYNLKNTWGSVFSHGIFFTDPKLIQIRDQILDKGFCKGRFAREFGIGEKVQKVVINVKSKTKGNEDKHWSMPHFC
jgi:sterol desaturase/sphingolipid hydroxylase (fatty acid hydroxylase superfamily)